MALILNGDGTVTGLAVGGLPSAVITSTNIVDATVAQTDLAAGVAGNGPAFSAWKGGTHQTGVASATWTKITFGAEEFDTNNCFDSTTNYRFQPSVPGYYLFTWQLDYGGNTVSLCLADIYKNGGRVKRSSGISVTNSETYVNGTALISMNGTSDYVELYAYIGGGGTIYGGSQEYSYFQGCLFRAA